MEPTPNGVRKFLTEKLGIDNDTTKEFSITSVRRYLAPSKKKTPMSKVMFAAPNERDLVLSYISSLPSDCDVETVVPNNLRGIKKHLETIAYRVRQHAKSRGTKTSTSIRLEEAAETLVLACKPADADTWTTYTKEELLLLDYGLKPRNRGPPEDMLNGVR